MVKMASSIRERASKGVDLGTVRRELNKFSTRENAIAAISYALWQIEGERVAYGLGDGLAPKRTSLDRERTLLERVLAHLSEASRAAHLRRLAGVPRASSAPNHLSAMVMQHVGKLSFQKILREVLAGRHLPPNAIHPPDNPGYVWASTNGLLPKPNPPVDQLLRQSDESFVATMLEDALNPGHLPDHPAVATRRLTLASAAERQMRYRVGQVEERIGNLSPRDRTATYFRELREAYERAGMLALRQRQSESVTAELEFRVKRLVRGPVFMSLRADCLQEAAAIAAKEKPDLWGAVLIAVVSHQRHCPEAKASFPCAECAPMLAKSITSAGRAPASVPKQPGHPATVDDVTIVERPNVPPADRELPKPAAQLREGALIVAVNAHANPRSTVVGLAWVSEDGQAGVATDHASSLREAQLLAICRAVADLQDTGLPIDILSPNQQVTGDARLLLRQTSGQPPAIKSEIPGATDLLNYLVSRAGKIQVHTAGSTHKKHEPLIEATRGLAKIALGVIRGDSSQKNLERKVSQVSERFSVSDSPRLLGPGESAASPTVRKDRDGLVWTQALHAHHLRSRAISLPAEIRSAIRQSFHGEARIPLTIYHRSGELLADKAMRTVRVQTGNAEPDLTSPGWPRDFFPGIIVKCSWQRRTKMLTAKTLRLGSPSRIEDRLISYDYDPRVLTRETAPGGTGSDAPKGLSVSDWVLRTLQILGYLDIDGRAVLAEESLERNMVELGFPAQQLHQVTEAVKGLIRDGGIRKVQGSIGPGGYPIFPAIRYRPPVELLSFQPKVAKARAESRPPTQRMPPPHRPQYVSGFVRRLPSGYTASDEAIDAHADAQRRAELANDGSLKPGYTFVRRHRRNH
ncbi:hypothetical protein ACRYCC_35380 [Actinomadura scrupuli]|uniref:hypothetical protein n=1 Tax=Actinomadura scrupuli TaxID=559629 RepID=UPI003D969A83